MTRVDGTEHKLSEIGAHTVHHRWLAGQSEQTVMYEVQESKKFLEQELLPLLVQLAHLLTKTLNTTYLKLKTHWLVN